MKITLDNIGKRFRREWIFRKVTFQITEGERMALLGPNGSGKSTLMKLLSGYLSPSKGKIVYHKNDVPLPTDELYQQVSFAAPYIELIEEFTLEEAIHFQAKFKPFRKGLRPKDIVELTGLARSKDKFIRAFSSGMKQRVKLALAICADTSLLLLDEPGTNLDRAGVAWYLDLAHRFMDDRTIVVASNVTEDFSFCKQQVNILDYKK